MPDFFIRRNASLIAVLVIFPDASNWLVGSKLSAWTGYSDKPLDAIGAVIVSALAVKILTFLNNQDVGSLVALITRRGGSGGTK